MRISFLLRGVRMWRARRSFTAVLVKQLLFICDHGWIQDCTSFSILISKFFFFFLLLLLFWLKACITFFLNYVSLCCDCYFCQFNSLWTGKLWNNCPLSFGINQLPRFKLMWQKLQWQIWEQSGFKLLLLNI